MESAARNPYDFTRPVFDLIPGGRVETRELETDEILERLRAIENQNAEILQIVGTFKEMEPHVESSSNFNSLWYLFWACQTIGLVSLITAELSAEANLTTDLRFLGLGLTLIALESAFLAKFAERRRAKYDRQDNQYKDAEDQRYEQP